MSPHVGFRYPLVVHGTAWAFDDGRRTVVRSAGVVEGCPGCTAVSLDIGLQPIVVVDSRPYLLGDFNRRRLTDWFVIGVVEGRPCLLVLSLGVGLRIGF